MKILPKGSFKFTKFPISKKNENTGKEEFFEGVIEITDEEYSGILKRTHRFSDDLSRVIELTQEEILEISNESIRKSESQKEIRNKLKRVVLMDAYRKYQASVNYGEIKRSSEIEIFVKSLKNKDWSVLDNIPKQLLYFQGKISFKDSGLISCEEV